MSEHLDTSLPQTLLFDHPSLRSIAGSLSLDRVPSRTLGELERETGVVERPKAISTRARPVAECTPAVVDTISTAFLEILGTVAAIDAPLASAGLDSIAMTELVTVLA